MLDEPIHLEAHRPEWAYVFRAERERLAKSLSLPPDRIVHIGSTAVAGLLAKPIIDIMVGLERLPLPPELESALVKAYYEAMGEAGVPGRWYFRCRVQPCRNVHVVQWDGPHWRQNLALRNYLRGSVGARERYQAAKLAAVDGGAVTLLAYSDAKGETVAQLLREAVQPHE